MSYLASSQFVCIVVLSIGAILVNVGEANTFLKVNPSQRQERISEEYIQTSLLAEVEGTFGMGSATSRLKQLEIALAPMFAALPKNQHGYLGHATVRYALHRLFLQRHGWFIKGLHEAGIHRNSTSTAGLLKEQIPSYVQGLFEQRLGGRGFGLHELAVVGATLEHLVHKEAVGHLNDALQVHSLLPTSLLNETEVDDVLDTYMTGYILGEDLSKMTVRDALQAKKDMPEVFLAWGATQSFVRSVRKNIQFNESSAEHIASGGFDFSLVARVAERVGEQFGRFQDHECHQIKASLVAMEEGLTGRVRLADFWKPALDGSWQFQESLTYLRQLGVLDESSPGNPRVMIANYISSPSNCIASSSFYSVCCMDECEDLLGFLEKEIAAPGASSELIATLVAKLPSSSVAAPRVLSKPLLERLEEIASGSDGIVQLHGRLFAQWMHHAFPRECPYPHVSGTTNPQTPDEWLESTGEETTATDEEMVSFIHNTSISSNETMALDTMLWSPEEELLIERPVHVRPASSTIRNVLMFVALATLALRLMRALANAPEAKNPSSLEKLLV